MPQIPPITVLLCTYNDARFLPQSVESVLNQTFAEFDFLIVDDGSTDETREWLDRLSDPRVRVLRNTTNRGLTFSLNRGLDAARGRYVARMDADDVAAPERLAAQFAFMEANPSVGIVGSSRTLIDEQDRFVAEARATEGDLAIRWKCLLGSPFAHPTVMLRRAVPERHGLRYREVPRAEDYDLWPRLLAHTRGANLPQPLLRYRLRERAAQSKAYQLAQHDRIALSAIQHLVPGFPITPDDVTQLRGRFGGYSVRDPAMDPADPHWVRRYARLREAFIAAHAGHPDLVAFASTAA
jgi:glycosyltransferase involved in cell wall biosynthesis